MKQHLCKQGGKRGQRHWGWSLHSVWSGRLGAVHEEGEVNLPWDWQGPTHEVSGWFSEGIRESSPFWEFSVLFLLLSSNKGVASERSQER